MMKRYYDSEQCTGCGNCIASCPKGLLRLSEWKNSKGLPVIIADETACVECGNCAVMCTTGATWFADKGDEPVTLVKKDGLPDHAGCALGILVRLLSEVIIDLGIKGKIVIFRSKKAEINLDCETVAMEAPAYFYEALTYKRRHPEKIVLIIFSDAKRPIHQTAWKLLPSLTTEQVTIIHTLDYFQQKDNFAGAEPSAGHLLEEIGRCGQSSYLARGSAKDPAHVKKLKSFIRHALELQIQGAPFSVVEFIYPCYYRLQGRPKEPLSYEGLKRVQTWFAEFIEPEFKTGVINNSRGEKKL